MRALVDRHHGDLFYSLQRLLEDRLGFEVYTPVGPEWWDESYWRFGVQAWGDDRLARQFLHLDANWQQRDGFSLSFDHAHPDRAVRGVTLPQVRATSGEWGLVVATLQDNQAGFHRLAGELGARYVLQVGNIGQQIDWSLEPVALVSTSEAPIPEGARAVRYHQEFDAEGTYGFADPAVADRGRLASMVNCLPHTIFWPRVQELAGALEPTHRISVHGIDGPDGNLAGAHVVAAAMRGAGWGLHCKTGDGFGHVLHSWAAVGRPLVGYPRYYRDLMGGPLWEDGVTCIDLDRRDVAATVALLREISAEPERHAEMCRAIRARFDELVDYDAEAAAIRELL